MVPKKATDDVSTGKFDVVTTHTDAKALLDGLNDDEVEERGMVAAIMGVGQDFNSELA